MNMEFSYCKLVFLFLLRYIENLIFHFLSFIRARKAKQFIERVFGPKAHKAFPRVTRTPGGGCNGKGFYPSQLQSTSAREYKYEGVDLLLVCMFVNYLISMCFSVCV